MPLNTESQGVLKYVSQYCQGQGVDIGCGRRKVVPAATGLDFAHEYDIPRHAETDADLIGSWEATLDQVPDLPVDYVYSSHLLEDYEDVEPPLRAWMNAVRPGGYLILVMPIEQVFLEHCREAGQLTNPGHKHDWAGADDFIGELPGWFRGQMHLEESVDGVGHGEYSFIVVFRKHERG